jgi:hypothetical protein
MTKTQNAAPAANEPAKNPVENKNQGTAPAVKTGETNPTETKTQNAAPAKELTVDCGFCKKRVVFAKPGKYACPACNKTIEAK